MQAGYGRPHFFLAFHVALSYIRYVHRIEYSKSALKSLRRMPQNMAEIIRRKIAELARDPYARNTNATKLQGRKGYRLRVGDWRVLYEIDGVRVVILIVDIKPRGGAYQ
ncbi:MAG TPA: type II toxin-antitoxin system RelE/ParE family toxin [Pirellulales bacterium]|jgi:mRNA interferase RelE/StbE